MRQSLSNATFFLPNRLSLFAYTAKFSCTLPLPYTAYRGTFRWKQQPVPYMKHRVSNTPTAIKYSKTEKSVSIISWVKIYAEKYCKKNMILKFLEKEKEKKKEKEKTEKAYTSSRSSSGRI